MVKRKSVTAFVLGLIGSLFCIAWGFFGALLGEALGGIIDAVESATSTSSGVSTSIISVLSWLCFFGGITGIVGASMCFKKAKTGAITLSIATAACGAFLIYVFVQISKSSNGISFTNLVIILLPFVLLIGSVIAAFLAKPMPAMPQYNGQYMMNGQYMNPQYMNAQYMNGQNMNAQQPNYPDQNQNPQVAPNNNANKKNGNTNNKNNQ